VTIQAHLHIVAAPGGQDVKEWCKKDFCWEKFREMKLAIPADLEAELITRERATTAASAHVIEDHASADDLQLIERVAAIPAESWFGLSAWAKDTNTLQAWQRSLAFSLGRAARGSKPPTRKQALHGEAIMTEARSLGFRG
jgi:hypothetical protein